MQCAAGQSGHDREGGNGSDSMARRRKLSPGLTSSCNNAEAVPHEEKDIYVIGLYPSPYHIFLQGKAVCVENVFSLCWTCRDMLSPGFGCRFYDISFNWIIHSRKDGVSFF